MRRYLSTLLAVLLLTGCATLFGRSDIPTPGLTLRRFRSSLVTKLLRKP